MADSKITALGSIGTGTDPANDQLVIVDVSDVLPTGMATTGTTKRVGLNQLLSSSPTATGAFSVTGLVTAGSATITGDLTVDTSTLKVDSTNNRVGIGTASPLSALHVGSGTGLNNLGVGLSRGATTNFFEAFDGTKTLLAGTDSAQAGVKVGSLTNHPLYLASNNTAQLEITHPGLFVFNDGAGGTRMTLNASGLGLGTATFGTSAAKVLAIGTGTEPTTGPAGTVQLFTSTRSASNTIPAIFCEGSGVTNAGITSTTVTNKIAIKVNGTIYYLLATTSAA